MVNGQDHLLEQQDLMLIGSNDWHIQYADHPVSFLTLSFSTKNALPPCLINRRLTLPPNLRNTIRLMLQEREEQNLYSYDYLESQLRGLLIELTRMVLDKKPAHETSASLPSTARAENQIVDEAVQIISQRICEKITLEDLADAVHVSVSYLCRIFNSHIGLPPGKYITRIRLEECKTLLREGEYSMGGIARRMGFSSAQHFSKQFRIHSLWHLQHILRHLLVDIRIKFFLFIKCFFKKFCIFPPVIIQDMRINIQDHIGLGMTGISLRSLDITAIQLQLISNAGMPEAVCNYRRQIVISNKFLQSIQDHIFTDRKAIGCCQYQVIVHIFIPHYFFFQILFLLPLDKHKRHSPRDENFSFAAFCFWLF